MVFDRFFGEPSATYPKSIPAPEHGRAMAGFEKGRAGGFTLVGGRLDYLNGRKVAALVYQRHKHVINLFIWPASKEAEEAPSALARQGYHLVHWTNSGLTYWAISDLNEQEVQEFVQ